MHDGEGPEAGDRNGTKGLLTKDAQAAEGTLKSGPSSTETDTENEESPESSGVSYSDRALWYQELVSAAIKARVANEELIAVTQAGDLSGVPMRGPYETARALALKARGVEVPSYDELVTCSFQAEEDAGRGDPTILDFPKVGMFSPYPQPRQDATMLFAGSPEARRMYKLNRGAGTEKHDHGTEAAPGETPAEPNGVHAEPLPCGWVRVTGDSREVQLDLFPIECDRYLALAGVSLDELRRWHDLEWLSFDPTGMDTLPHPQWHEIIFIRNLARSGLTHAWIQRLLDELEPPYRYDPLRTVYSFALGWVQIPPITEDGIDAFVAEHLPRWIAEKALWSDLEPLMELQATIALEIAQARSRQKRASIYVADSE